MAFYEVNLGILVLLNGFIFYRQRSAASSKSHQNKLKSIESGSDRDGAAVRDFVKIYLVGHLLAFAGDWLQGPHLYAVYKYDKHLEERAVALLYGTGFVSAALGATFVGQWADKFGRRKACLLYCAAYTMCCVSMVSDTLVVLLAGKVLGGVSTTLLYSTFDAWMITEYNKRNLGNKGLSLGSLYGWLTFLNSIVAIAMGVVGEMLVKTTGTKIAPFMFASFVFMLAAAWISTTWTENFGDLTSGSAGAGFISAFLSSVREMWQDKRIFALTAASSIFESMMYLFVFFWSAAIVSARAYAGAQGDTPFGTVFGCFMCTMMAGSMLFNATVDTHDVANASRVLMTAMALGSISLFLAVNMTSREYFVFYAFCLTELCVGMYYPSINFLKSAVVEDGSRARIYSLMRVPLSTFVVVAHSLAEEGDHHRNNIFLTFGGALLLAYMIAGRYLQAKSY